MNNEEIISGLRAIALDCDEAWHEARSKRLRNGIRSQQMFVLAAADAIAKLQDRLVRQAHYFEHIEASNSQRWPLLDGDDPGASL